MPSLQSELDRLIRAENDHPQGLPANIIADMEADIEAHPERYPVAVALLTGEKR